MDTNTGGIDPASLPTPKEPLETIYLFSGIPRSIPRVDPDMRKPIGWLPHARGYRNGFLGEANDASNLCVSLYPPFFLYAALKVMRKPTLERAIQSSHVLKIFYGMTASFGVFAGLSLAGFEYRRFDLMKRKPGSVQENEDSRKEKDAFMFSAIGAAVRAPLAWGIYQTQETLSQQTQMPRLSYSRRIAFGLGGACFLASILNGGNRYWRKMDIGSRPS